MVFINMICFDKNHDASRMFIVSNYITRGENE